MANTTCPSCSGDLLDATDYSVCDTCDYHTDTGYHRDVISVECEITLLDKSMCSHCTKFKAAPWVTAMQAPGYSPPIREIGANTVPSLEAYPPPLPALAVEGSTKPDPSGEWGPSTITVRSVPRPKGFHWQVSGRPGGYIEGGWMDTESPSVDMLDQPIEDSWY